ncbi:hypothetical protein [Falsiroseomonas sp. HW251]|uniref:hypothetical protein n=1 Tax=Falsiroseomonas sp. HW251 TaxID=3390998 RepID=UPI003D310543
MRFEHDDPRPGLDTGADREAIRIAVRMTLAMTAMLVVSVLAWTGAFPSPASRDEVAPAPAFQFIAHGPADPGLGGSLAGGVADARAGRPERDVGEGTAFALAASTGSAAGAAEEHELIAFCRPQPWAAKPCLCSIESVEVAVTPGQFVRYMQDRRAAGATSAAELRTAMRHAGEVCGESAIAAPPAGASVGWAVVRPGPSRAM